MAERFFTKIANDVLEATETIANQLDDGWNQVFSQKASSDSTPFDGDEDIEDILKESPLQGMADQVIQGILGDSKVGPQGFWENVQAFCAAITWTEPFVIGLVMFQVIMFALTIYVTRPSVDTVPRLVLLLVIGTVVRTAEYSNDYAAQHWQEWGITQNYFDSRGLFMAVLLSAPLLMDSLIMLVCFLREAKNLLIQAKTLQILQQRRSKKKDSTASERRSKKEQ